MHENRKKCKIFVASNEFVNTPKDRVGKSLSASTPRFAITIPNRGSAKFYGRSAPHERTLVECRPPRNKCDYGVARCQGDKSARPGVSRLRRRQAVWTNLVPSCWQWQRFSSCLLLMPQMLLMPPPAPRKRAAEAN